MTRTCLVAMAVSLYWAAVPASAAEKDDAQARSQCMRNLQHLGLALHTYHNAKNSFPAAASFDSDGTPLLSWRVHILPYLDQADLYKQFRLDEPWDSASNRKLIKRMPKVFACPGHDLYDQGKTTYLAPHGKDLAFETDRAVSIREFRDGTSNTLLLVDADEDQATIWTKPADLEIDLKKPTKGLGSAHKKGFNGLYADGSVRLVPSNIKPDTLQRLLQRNDGQIIPAF